MKDNNISKRTLNDLKKLKYCIIIIVILLSSGCNSYRENFFLKGFMLEGFEQYGALTVYNQENLFDYMNGEAEIYLSNTFQNLYLQNYLEYETGAEILVEVYDMEGSKGAKNIFSEYTKDSGTYLKDLGESAWTDNYMVLFTRGMYFCRIWPEPTSELEAKPKMEDLVNISKYLDMILK